jgi:transposase-like protein
LTPQGTDGRSNRLRFTDEQKRAMVQEKGKAWRCGGCSLPYGIATSQLFRWRVQFGLIARKNAATRDGDTRRRRREPNAAISTLLESGAGARRDDGYQDGDRAQPA